MTADFFRATLRARSNDLQEMIDHGTAGCAFLAGGAVRGGRVITDWPGLSRAALLDGRDLRPSLDLRSVFKTVLSEHLRVDAKSLDARVFPDSSTARPLQGLIRA